MDAIVRAIKDLDPVAFQQLCFHIMSERFPLAKVRYPEGAAGDDGVDLFHGDLTGGATVWQCKAFQVTLLGDSQKEQIRKSLRDVANKVKPKQWILCLNLSLDTKAVRWFKRLQDSYLRLGIEVADPVDAMNLARELMYRRTIRNYFFPNLVLDVHALKALMKASSQGLESIDDSVLEQLTIENAEEYLDRLSERDSRFTYEVTFGGERGPHVFPPPAEHNLVVAMSDGRKTTKAFARDHEALKQDPVASHIRFSRGGEQKILDLIRTGKRQHWEPNEIRTFKSTVPLLSDIKFLPGSIAMHIQSVPDDRIIPLRLVFSADASRVTMDYREFRRVRSGLDEVEIATVGTPPLQMSFVLPTDLSKTVMGTFSIDFAGHYIRDVAESCAALRLLQASCDLEIHSLKLSAMICKLHVESLPIPSKKNIFKLVEDLAAIAAKFNVNFLMPTTAEFTEDEEETLKILRAFALNEPVELSSFTVSITKSSVNSALIPQHFRNDGAFRIEHESAAATLFGTPITLGATCIHIGPAEVLNVAATMKRFSKAKMGTAIPIRLRPLAPVRFEIIEQKDLLARQSRNNP